jgi:hypothetical protein
MRKACCPLIDDIIRSPSLLRNQIATRQTHLAPKLTRETTISPTHRVLFFAVFLEDLVESQRQITACSTRYDEKKYRLAEHTDNPIQPLPKAFLIFAQFDE